MKRMTLMLCILMLAGTSYGGTLYLISKNGTGWSGQNSGNTSFATVTSVNLSSPSKSFNAWYLATTFVSGDAVWVLSDASAYTLTAPIVIKAQGKIYGGFAGTETTSTISASGGRQLIASPAGNWDLANPTVFDGNNTLQGITGGSSSMIIDGLTIQNCKYTGGGSAQAAGISCTTSTTVRNCIVTGCTSAGTASAGASSALALTSGAKLQNSYIHHNTFSNTSGYGGGAVSIVGHANYGSATPISGCKITDNTNNGTPTYAGGLYMYSGIANGFAGTTILNCTISNNTTVGQGGGIGIYIAANVNNTANTTPIVISGCTINSNSTTYAAGATGGGGIFFNNITVANTNNNVTVQNCSLIGNRAAVGTTSNHGGALNSTGNITLNNCIIASNTGTNAIYMGFTSGVSATVQNCTFANNVDAATTPAAAAVLYSNIPVTASTFTNTIIYNQTVSPLNVSTGQKPVTTYCGFDASVSLESAPYNGTGNINTIAAESFVNSASDFRLAAGSTAVDAGTTLSTCSPDISNISRPQGDAYDMGAYEYVKTTPVITWSQSFGSLQKWDTHTLTAASNAGAYGSAIVYTAADPAVALIRDGNIMDLLKLGNTTVSASQAANTFFNAATSVTKDIVVDLLTAIPQSTVNNLITQSPNCIKSNVNGTMQIISISGRMVQNTTVSTGQTINLKSGMYIVRTTTNNGTFTQKVVL